MSCVRSAALRMSQSTVEKFRLPRSNSAAAGIFCSTDRPHDLPGRKMKFKDVEFLRGQAENSETWLSPRRSSEATVAFVSTQIQRALRCKLPCCRSVPAGDDYLSPYSLAALSWVTLRRTFSDKQPNSCSRKRIESGQVPSGWG